MKKKLNLKEIEINKPINVSTSRPHEKQGKWTQSGILVFENKQIIETKI